MLAPVVPRRNSGLVDVDDAAQEPSARSAHRIASTARSSVSVVEWLEYKLHPYSAFVIVPVFALANAGIRIPASEVGDALSSPVTWGVILGLVVGKTVGIAGATFLAVVSGVGRLPPGITPRHVVGAAALGGIGFTVSLFVTELAFGETLPGRDARLGVLIGSLTAATIGALILVPGRRSAARPDAVHVDA
jgi:NhaA family Na+:H+ antiporter